LCGWYGDATAAAGFIIIGIEAGFIIDGMDVGFIMGTVVAGLCIIGVEPANDCWPLEVTTETMGAAGVGAATVAEGSTSIFSVVSEGALFSSPIRALRPFCTRPDNQPGGASAAVLEAGAILEILCTRRRVGGEATSFTETKPVSGGDGPVAKGVQLGKERGAARARMILDDCGDALVITVEANNAWTVSVSCA
jgi:hypothetical protein